MGRLSPVLQLPQEGDGAPPGSRLSSFCSKQVLHNDGEMTLEILGVNLLTVPSPSLPNLITALPCLCHATKTIVNES